MSKGNTSKSERARLALAQAKVRAIALGVSLLAFARTIEPTDASFLLGLLFLRDGLVRTFDVGIANVVIGVVLVATPLALIIRSQPTKKE